MRRPVLFLAVVAMVAAVLVQTQPAYATPPSGALLNPSVDSNGNGPGTIISDNNDGTDKRYHFTVRALPTTAGATVALVRIQILPPGAVSFITVGNATRVGTTDTWELFWDQTDSGIAEGSGAKQKVRALIQDSNGEVAFVPNTDGQAVQFDNSLGTAEMTTPPDGGQLGFDSSKTATLAGTASGDTTEINAFYTVSPAGQPQTWKSCGANQPVPPNPGGTTTWTATCQLVNPDTPAQVQAVAVVPISDVPIPQTPGSGDAHRLSGTVSVQPNSVTIVPASTLQSTEHCNLFTMIVTDASGHSVGGAHVNVHAQGPGNDLYFATVSGHTSTFTSPINPGAGHNSYETADTCDKNNAGSGGGLQPAGPGQAGQEGVHTGSTPNTKHIDGLTGAAGFIFALVSHSVGQTSVQGWLDANTNDQHDPSGSACPVTGSSEPCGVASVSWELPAPASVTISPELAHSPTGKSVKETATVIDQHQNPMSGQPVSFTVAQGPNSTQDLDGDPSTPPGYYGFCVTGGDGTCPKSYTDKAKQNGVDKIKGFVDSNGDLTVQSTELQASAQHTWGSGNPGTKTPTSLTIQPHSTQTIHRGEAVDFHGQLSSKSRSCVAGQTVILFSGKGEVARFTIKGATVVKGGKGFAGKYSFTEHPSHTQTYHAADRGNAKCGSSRAPGSGGVKVVVQ